MHEPDGKTASLKCLPYPLLIVGVASLSAVLKLSLLAIDVVPFNSDEAIVGLMARHILQGRWQPFFYGQAYMGSLDSALVAIGYALFGPSVMTIRLVQILLYIGTVTTTGVLGWMIFESKGIGILASILMLIPSVNITLYTTVSLGGYGEALLIGNLLLISALKISSKPSIGWYLVWGFLAGIGIWAFGLTLIYVLPTILLLVYHAIRNRKEKGCMTGFLLSLVALIAGLTPWFSYAISKGFKPLIEELFGSAISGASPANVLLATLSHIYNFILFGPSVIFGLRPPWQIRWLAWPLMPLALAFWSLVLLHAFLNLKRHEPARTGRWLLCGVMTVLALGFILTPFGADPSGRYFLPFTIPLSIFAAELIMKLRHQSRLGKWIYSLPAAILVFNLWGTIEVAVAYPPGLTTQFDPVSWIDHRSMDELIQFLNENKEIRGYTNYWVAYPLAFQSDERLIFVPGLPYHEDFRYTSRDNRYQPYNDAVEDSGRVAYITTNHPALDEALRQSFQEYGITWLECWIGDYHIFYCLSDVVRPSDLHLETLVQDG